MSTIANLLSSPKVQELLNSNDPAVKEAIKQFLPAELKNVPISQLLTILKSKSQKTKINTEPKKCKSKRRQKK